MYEFTYEQKLAIRGHVEKLLKDELYKADADLEREKVFYESDKNHDGYLDQSEFIIYR